jgi:hypothetical protein
VDVLISEGHSFGEIKKYSFPQFLLFLDLIGRRYDKQAAPSNSEPDNRQTYKSYRDNPRH